MTSSAWPTGNAITGPHKDKTLFSISHGVHHNSNHIMADWCSGGRMVQTLGAICHSQTCAQETTEIHGTANEHTMYVVIPPDCCT